MRRQLLALVCGLWLLGSLAALAALVAEAGVVLDSALAETAERLGDLPDAALDAARPEASHVAAYPSAEYVVYQVYDAAGRLRLRSHSAPDRPLDGDASDGLRDVDGWRVLTLVDRERGRRVLVAQSLPHRRALVWSSVRWLAATLLVVLALAAWGLRSLLRHGFAALDASRRELQRRGSGDLGPIAVAQAPSELQPWLEAVNALMQRVRILLDAERSFAGHAAHELRTPLAAARAHAQRIAESTRGDDALAANAQALVRQLDRLAALATRVLQLARVESGVALGRHRVDLAELVEWVADEFGEALRSGRLQVDEPIGRCAVDGDVDALGLALRNLVDNALKHGGEHVRLRAERCALVVRDDGRGIAAEDLARVRRPFERGGSRDVEGAGLGLTIVERVAAQSHARLLLLPGGEASGFEARIEFDTPAHSCIESDAAAGTPGSASVHRAA